MFLSCERNDTAMNLPYTKEKISLLTKLAESHMERAELFQELALMTASLAIENGEMEVEEAEIFFSSDHSPMFAKSFQAKTFYNLS